MHNQKASILLYTLLMLSVITFITLQLVRSVNIGRNFDKYMVSKEQARVLALGGINLAISQLTIEEPKKKESQEKEKKDDNASLKKFLKKVLPNLNRWQTFNLTEKFDGFEGEISFCITCENGKININEAFDFEKQEFKKEYSVLLQGLHIKNKLPEGEILKRLTEFFKERKKKLDDVSELVEVSGLEFLDMYYQPPEKAQNKKPEKFNSTITLQDLFTVFTVDEKMELLFFSDAMLAVLGMRQPLASDAEKLKSSFNELIENFKKNWGTDWEKNWQYMAPIFGEYPKILKNISGILSKEFGPKIYSVLSCGKVNNVKQKVLVVIKEMEEHVEKKGEEKSLEKKDDSLKKYFKILKMYWI
ncbi:hypothetical protein K9L05_03880 [Candidatus Babeliales bacterium]|nr:hypothetical protein [Candidatus Babeliales bacterium]MCF7899756.1 hypothetical protein [Candidatus Babeliales bacterium]